MKLAGKLTLLFLSVVFVLTALTGYLTVRREYQAFLRRHERQSLAIGGASSGQLRMAWNERGGRGLYEAVETIDGQDRDVRVRWVWLDGKSPLSEPTSDIERAIADTMRSSRRTIITRTEDGLVRTYYPVQLDAHRGGGLELSTGLAEVDRQTRDTIRMTLVSMAAMALCAVGIVYVAGIRMVGRPLEQLVEKTRRAGEGDFSRPVEIRSHDELAQLGAALNAMCTQLAAQQQTIRDELEARRATEDQLRHADRLKTVGRLAAGVAHEVGTPLNVVSGRAGLIARGKLSPAEITSSAEIIQAESRRIAAIVRQLLDFARQNAPRRVQVDPRTLIESTVQLLQPLAKKQAVAIQVQAADDCPQLLADEGQLQQVLTNIIVNGIQAMPNGGQLIVRVADAMSERLDGEGALEAGRTGPTEDGCRIEIEDQGVGIPEDQLGQIFDPFFTTKEVGQGTGLGLSISHSIIEEHGGTIRAASRLGQGTRFTIYLPVERSCPATS